MVMKIEESRNQPEKHGLAFFQTGFRPFFLAAGFFMVLALSAWLWVFAGGGYAPHYYGPVGWHAHEMLFGYATAVIAGFLLTAAGNWTGGPTARGKNLAALFILWLAGRILPWFDFVVAEWVIAIVDLVFLPALAIIVALPLIHHRQKRNFIFIALLTLMTLANILVHAQLLGFTLTSMRTGIDSMVYLILLLIIIMGGRVIPFFTERGVEGVKIVRRSWVDALAIASFLLLAGVDLLGLPATYISAAALLAAISHLIRLANWFDKRILMEPLVWVLHSAYGWIIIGFILKALGVGPYATHALHAFAAGGIGIMTLGMMCRVALGHTGRPLAISPIISMAFVVINIAVFIRVISPIFLLGVYVNLVTYAGALYAISFLLFAWIYNAILINPRIDGRPG